MSKIKSILTLAALTLCTSVFAQDIITLRNGTEIKAIVKEVGADVVKYKKFSMPQGTTYMLKKANILMIEYANGEAEVFSKPAQATSQPAQAASQPTPPPPPAKASKAQATTTESTAPIELRRFAAMDDRDMDAFLANADREIYKKFHSGVKLRRAGKGLLWPGLGLSVAGVAFIVLPAAGITSFTGYNDVDASIGMVALGVGQALIITSIPLSAVGGSLKKRAKYDYIDKYRLARHSSTPTLNVISSGNGIGLALRF